MIRRAAGLAAATLAIVAAVEITAWLLARTDPLPARFAAQDCRRIALVDSRTGWPVSGAEDLALTPDGGTLIVAAHDRRDPAQPDGGLYAVPVRDLAAGRAGAVPARPLVDPAARQMPFRPHGIALSPDGRRLALVNRVARREAVVEIGRLDGSGWRPEAIVRDPALCRANDLAFEETGTGGSDVGPDAGTDAGADFVADAGADAWGGAGPEAGADARAEAGGGAVLVTIDRADCGASFRDLVPWARTGSVARTDGQGLATVRTGLAFPNGIAAGPGPDTGPGAVTLAETRAGRLLGAQGREVPLSGAPDNLTVDGGALVVAVHTDLMRLWLHRQGMLGRVPSRILRVAADDSVETLFDDPGGALISGATVGLVAGNGLIAGSARDAGLLVCGDPS